MSSRPKVVVRLSTPQKRQEDLSVRKSETETSAEPSVLKIQAADGRFSILRPARVDQNACQITLTQDPEELLEALRQVKLKDEADLVALDFETNGTQVFGNASFRAVTFGICHGNKAVSLDLRDMDRQSIINFLQNLRSVANEYKIPLAAHNLFFDGSVAASYLGSVRGDDSGAPGWLHYRYCTYALFRYLASEGFVGQSHSLKFAMTELLGWKDTNEAEQTLWLISNGFVKGNKGITDADTEESAEKKLQYLRGRYAAGKSYKPNKAMMYKVPHEILGRYNALDCYATYHLYREVLLPTMQRYTTDFFAFWHSGPMLMSIRNAIDNYQNGIFVDPEILYTFRTDFTKQVREGTYKDFAREMPEVYWKISGEKFETYTKTKAPKNKYKAGPKEPVPPKRERDKNGYLTKAQLNYLKARRKFDRHAPEYSKLYLRFLGRRKLLKRWIADGMISTHFTKKHWAYKWLFNPGSPSDKEALLFTDVEYEIIPSKYKDKPGRLRLRNGVEVDMSDSGKLPTGKAAITAIRGKKFVLNRYNRDLKKLQFVEACYHKVSTSSDGLLHVGYKVPGTNSQRNSGADGVSLQNLIKAPEFLRAWRPRDIENYLLYQIDENAVEPHILTEMSRCKAMMKLYGPGAKSNDLYIFNAAGIGGDIGRPFLEEGYDPDNPVREVIKRCKEKHKELRNVSKQASLSDDYGSGVYKKWQSFRIAGYPFTMEEVTVIHNNLRKLYEDKFAYGEALDREYERNGRFVLDGFGFPTCLDSEKKKDLINRVTQKTAALILTLWQYILVPKMWENKIDYYWMIYNFHDEMIPEVHRSQIVTMKRLYAETLAELNEKWLKGMIKIKAEPQIATCLAEIKVENYVEEELKHLMEGIE